MTNATETTCFSADDDPYGLEKDHSTPCSPTCKFAGYEYDSETVNHYAHARYYDSRIDRFLSPDPFGGSIANPPRSLHKHRAVHIIRIGPILKNQVAENTGLAVGKNNFVYRFSHCL